MKGVLRDSNSIHIDMPWGPTPVNDAPNAPADWDWFEDQTPALDRSPRGPKRRRDRRIRAWVTEEEYTAVVTRASMMTSGDIGEYVRRRCLGQRLHANVGGHAVGILMHVARAVAERYPADREFHDEIISAIEAAGLAANL